MQIDSSHSRFFIALMLPEAIEHYVNQVIEDLGDRYHTRTARAAPHITLQPPFLWPIESVETLEGAIDQVASTQYPMSIQLSGFGCFAPRVIYIDVVKTPELLEMQNTLMTRMEKMLGSVDTKAQNRSFSPHVTVASRKMNPRVFKQAWGELEKRAVNVEFVCDRLTLLIHNTQRWNTHQSFQMQRQPHH